ncbi:MAG: hypothetical protein M3416_08190 [Acidobacteriota bacterium]|nr:hypothetical protein [Acidobacteriota bacterium]
MIGEGFDNFFGPTPAEFQTMKLSTSIAAEPHIAHGLLAQDPVLHDLQIYDEFRRRNARKLRRRFKETLLQAASLEPSVAPFCQHLERLLPEVEALSRKEGAIDPYFSTIFRLWMVALERGLDWVQCGVAPAFLGYFADLPAMEKDLATEYPHLAGKAGTHPVRLVGETIRLIPVDAVADSPRFSGRIQECLPGYPDEEVYGAVDEAALDVMHDHLELSLKHLRELDRVAYLGLKRNIHTIYVALMKTGKKSFGSRYDCPGSLIAAFPEQRLREGDTYITASQFYHEHCHTKLSLYCQVLEPDLPPDSVYISSFKNENRTMECILHTIYPITMECAIRLALLPFYDESMRQRAVAYLAAVGFRLRLISDIFSSDPISGSASEFKQIKELCAVVLALIEAEIQTCPPHIRKAHRQELGRVLKRHAWDIGQFLCRNVEVKDPGLSEVTKGDGRAQFTFQGKRYTASLKPGRPSFGNYGYYIESML